MNALALPVTHPSTDEAQCCLTLKNYFKKKMMKTRNKKPPSFQSSRRLKNSLGIYPQYILHFTPTVSMSVLGWSLLASPLWLGSSDGLGPEKLGQGRARDLKSQSWTRPGLEPFNECRALEFYYVQQSKSSDFPDLPQKLGSRPARA